MLGCGNKDSVVYFFCNRNSIFCARKSINVYRFHCYRPHLLIFVRSLSFEITSHLFCCRIVPQTTSNHCSQLWCAMLNYSAPVGQPSIAISFSVCASACVSGTAGPIFTKFVVQIPCGSGSVPLWRRCDKLCTSGFMDDVTFGRSGPYGDAWLATLRYRGGVWCLWMPCFLLFLSTSLLYTVVIHYTPVVFNFMLKYCFKFFLYLNAISSLRRRYISFL